MKNRRRDDANARQRMTASQRMADPQPPFSYLAWPLVAAAEATATSASVLYALADVWSGRDQDRAPAPTWTTPNQVNLNLPSMRLRDFSSSQADRPATLVCAPYALHGASIVDFAPGHSVVEALIAGGLDRVFVTDWRSATPEMQFFSIDTYLADLNVAIDELGPPVDLVGLCQGGWMALVYAARFPEKVRRLVLAGAPIDVRAADSALSRMTANLPLALFENLVRAGGGRVLGESVRKLWTPALAADEPATVLQVETDLDADKLSALEARFKVWDAWTVDLPGTYYLQVVRCLFHENQIAEGRLVALGRAVDLTKLRAPAFLLAARDDAIVAPAQLFATARLIGRPDTEMATEPCGHLSLFFGARTLGGIWRRIADWLLSDETVRAAHGEPHPRD